MFGEAIDHMTKWKVPPQEVQEKMLGGNARRLYGIEPRLVVTEGAYGNKVSRSQCRAMPKLTSWNIGILEYCNELASPGYFGSIFVELLDKARKLPASLTELASTKALGVGCCRFGSRGARSSRRV